MMLLKIVDFLPRGEKNAVPSRHLVEMLGFRSVRDLQKAIERERNSGAVILSTCTDGGGYFRPEDTEEIKRFIRTLSSRAKNTERSIERARLKLQRLEGGITLE